MPQLDTGLVYIHVHIDTIQVYYYSQWGWSCAAAVLGTLLLFIQHMERTQLNSCSMSGRNCCLVYYAFFMLLFKKNVPQWIWGMLWLCPCRTLQILIYIAMPQLDTGLVYIHVHIDTIQVYYSQWGWSCAAAVLETLLLFIQHMERTQFNHLNSCGFPW